MFKFDIIKLIIALQNPTNRQKLYSNSGVLLKNVIIWKILSILLEKKENNIKTVALSIVRNRHLLNNKLNS